MGCVSRPAAASSAGLGVGASGGVSGSKKLGGSQPLFGGVSGLLLADLGRFDELLQQRNEVLFAHRRPVHVLVHVLRFSPNRGSVSLCLPYGSEKFCSPANRCRRNAGGRSARAPGALRGAPLPDRTPGISA